MTVLVFILVSGTKSVIYRITARGTGGSDSTQTILRSHYARAY